MKYVHTDGTEYEVAGLVEHLRAHAAYAGPTYGPPFAAAAALIARHGRVCEKLRPITEEECSCQTAEYVENIPAVPPWTCYRCQVSAALRGEEAPGSSDPVDHLAESDERTQRALDREKGW